MQMPSDATQEASFCDIQARGCRTKAVRPVDWGNGVLPLSAIRLLGRLGGLGGDAKELLDRLPNLLFLRRKALLGSLHTQSTLQSH